MEMMTRRMKREKRKKMTSLMKLALPIAISFEVTRKLMTPKTALETKNAPPRMLLRPTAPSLDLVKETTLAKKSGAPFPRESKVTPAMVGDSLKMSERPSRLLQK